MDTHLDSNNYYHCQHYHLHCHISRNNSDSRNQGYNDNDQGCYKSKPIVLLAGESIWLNFHCAIPILSYLILNTD